MLQAKKTITALREDVTNALVHRPYAQMLASLQGYGFDRTARFAIKWRFNVRGIGVGLDGGRYRHGWEPEDTAGDTPIMTALRACEGGEISATTRLLLDRDVDLMKENANGQNAFHVAVHPDSTAVLQAVCEQWKKAHEGSSLAIEYPSLLSEMAFAAGLPVVKYLRDNQGYSASEDAKGEYFSPLFSALEGKQTEVQAYLLNEGADPEERFSKDGISALDYACQQKDIDAVKQLIMAGATVTQHLIEKAEKNPDISEILQVQFERQRVAVEDKQNPSLAPASRRSSNASSEELGIAKLKIEGKACTPAYNHVRSASTSSQPETEDVSLLLEQTSTTGKGQALKS